MKIEELRKLTTEELQTKIKESKEELFNLRFQQATGNLEKPVRLRDLRKQVAKMKTIIRERELGK
jgi:large subunit ribosomal protein L29